MGNLINRTIGEFKVQAFYQGKFMDVTREDTLGHWSVFFFLCVSHGVRGPG